jgi:hypothetical protein
MSTLRPKAFAHVNLICSGPNNPKPKIETELEIPETEFFGYKFGLIF